MGLFQKLGFTSQVTPAIDWELLPAETFSIFESWGGKIRISSPDERFYYFFIDTWENPATLCLMERGIKFARVLARIDAPQGLIDKAVAGQGKTMGLDKSYAIDEELKKWLIENVVDGEDDSKVIPLASGIEKESLESGLPGKDTPLPADMQETALPQVPQYVQEEDVENIAKQSNFYDSQHNPGGSFTNFLVDNGDGLTVTDKATGLMWQRGGNDITSIRKAMDYVKKMNEDSFAGFSDWHLPNMAQALSLMEQEENDKGVHLHRCFSKEQPFIFVSQQRDPGGYWFCDFKQGTLFWASGTIPGGFSRLCRKQ